MKFYLKTRDFFLTQEKFSLFYDDKYEMLRTRPLPTDLGKYYEDKQYISHTDTNSGVVSKMYHIVKKFNLSRKLKLINKHCSSDRSLLDVGAGTGDFLLYAKERGWTTAGVEPSQTARHNALKKSVELSESKTQLGEQKFQVITLWHVLEHIPSFESEIESLNSRLKDKGILVIALPNYNAMDAKYYKEFWAAFDVPRHVSHFSRKSIKIIAERNNLKLVSINPMWFDSFYVSLLSERYKRGNNNFFMAAVLGVFSNLCALFTGEFSSLIYVLQKR